MYIRAKDIANVPKHYHIAFKTKLQQAAELVEWANNCCKQLHKELWVVTDGGYTRRGFLKPVISAGVTVISRLRCDASLHDIVKPVKKRKQGRPRTYGQRIYLSQKFSDKSGWLSIKATLYGKEETKQVKMFTAMYRPAGSCVLVLIVRQDRNRFRAFMCSNLSATAQEILEAVADRVAIEQNFHDLKEIEGAGQQQLRHFWANIGAFHLNMWVHTMVELWAWEKPLDKISDRSDSPWDKNYRRPSHANRCAGLRREIIVKTFFATSGHNRKTRKIVRQFYKLMKLAS